MLSEQFLLSNKISARVVLQLMHINRSLRYVPRIFVRILNYVICLK